MKASDLFVESLEKEGVEYIFGIAGEENLDLLQSLSNSDIKLVLTRHEQAAGFMAATYGRLTGKAGVCLSTLGPGATNLMTAAAFATLGAMPMVMLTGQKPIKTSKQGQFQILDVVDTMKPITKFTRQIESADLIPASVREAFRLAQEERPGATHLELPEDIAKETSDRAVIKPSSVRRPVAESRAIDTAVDRIKEARNPILIIGAGANRNKTCRAIRRLVEKTGIRVVATQMGKGVVNERDESFIGCAALSTGDFVHRAIDAADLIINIGHDVVEKPPFFMEDDGSTVIHINYVSARVDPVYFPQIEVVGDIAESIRALEEKLEPGSFKDAPVFDRIRNALQESISQRSEDDRFPVLPQRLVADVRKVMPDDGVIALDNGIYKLWFARNYPACQPKTMLLDNALATMGAGLPAAMAAAMVYPDRRILSVCGDGGFMMNSAELETAVRLKQNLVILILRDDALGMIKWKQENEGFDDYGLDFGNPDFVDYAEAYGAKGFQLSSASELSSTMEKAFATDGVCLIDVPVDYSLNDEILNNEFKAASEALAIR